MFVDGDDVDYVEGRPPRRFSCTSEERIVFARNNEEERERERLLSPSISGKHDIVEDDASRKRSLPGS